MARRSLEGKSRHGLPPPFMLQLKYRTGSCTAVAYTAHLKSRRVTVLRADKQLGPLIGCPCSLLFVYHALQPEKETLAKRGKKFSTLPRASIQRSLSDDGVITSTLRLIVLLCAGTGLCVKVRVS